MQPQNGNGVRVTAVLRGVKNGAKQLALVGTRSNDETGLREKPLERDLTVFVPARIEDLHDLVGTHEEGDLRVWIKLPSSLGLVGVEPMRAGADAEVATGGRPHREEAVLRDEAAGLFPNRVACEQEKNAVVALAERALGQKQVRGGRW